MLVAKERNICQSCLNDLQYGLPVGMRDQLLEEEGKKKQLALTATSSLPVVQQHYQKLKRDLAALGDDDEDDGAVGVGGIWAKDAPGPPSLASKQLTAFSQQMYQRNNFDNKTAMRNLPKLCSFWLNGACNRVLRKTCPFRPCCGTFIFPEIARTNKELHEKLIERLNNEGAAAVMKSLDNETRTAIQQALKGNREETIRKRVSGEDDLSKAYLNNMKQAVSSNAPPLELCY